MTRAWRHGLCLALLACLWLGQPQAQTVAPTPDGAEPAQAPEALHPEPPKVLATGLASWYSPRLHGRKTASGERFDVQALTAAHRSLPLGSWVEVHNPANGHRVTVKINDRGPRVRGVVIDLSPRAAQQLDLLRAGRGRVDIALVADPAS